MKTLETVRMILRPFTLEDLEDFYEYASMETVGPNAGWAVHENKDQSKSILESFIQKDDVLAIFHRQDKKVIGSIGLHCKVDESGESHYEIGYVLSTPYEGRGLMTEAVKRVLEHAFLDLNINCIDVYHFIENMKSRRVIEKCNFEYIGNIQYETLNFGTKDSRAYQLTKQQFIKSMEE